MKKTKKIVFMSMMLSYSLILYFIEAALPSLYFIAPGAKLGLANIISLILLYISGFWTALVVLILRIVMASIFGGGFSSFIYSFCGGIFAILAMGTLKKMNIQSLSEIGVSVAGAVFFNIGQLFAASLMIENLSIFVYLPVMIYVSIATGIFVGFVSKFVIQKLEKSLRMKS
ncbi:MAG: Gx transporter family protein [Peptostreptococcaceae bacterium]|nr:Gx transporter family protein [Peptostreptococcaceae bacterium]